MPTFEDATLPVAERENEFRQIVEWLIENRPAVKAYTIAGDAKDKTWTLEKAEAQLAVDKRKMAAAGREYKTPTTIRTKSETLEDGKTLKVYVWAAAKKITRTVTKPAEAPANADGK